jgi:Fanconi anemia group M protein
VGVSENAVRGALAAVALDFGVPILWSCDNEDTAGFLYVIAKREQLGKRPFEVKALKKPLSQKQMQEYIVSALPGVGPGLARRLLQKFETVEDVFRAPEHRLAEVDKIGLKKAERIREVLEARYK